MDKLEYNRAEENILLTPNQVFEYLLIENGWIAKTESYLPSMPGYDIYELRDNRVIYVPPYTLFGFMFSTRWIAESYLKDCKSQGKSYHDVMPGLFPFDDDFLSKKDELILNLPKLLHIPEDVIDYSLESLTVIDQALMNIDRDDPIVISLFPALVAYCGEVIIGEVAGEWTMIKLQGIGLWQPRIKCRNSEYLFDPFKPPYKRLMANRSEEDIEENGGDRFFHLDSGITVEISMSMWRVSTGSCNSQDLC